MSGTLAAYLAFTVVFAGTPGVTTAVVIQQSVAGGWRRGLATAAGAALANAMYGLVSAIGLAVFINHVPVLRSAVRIGGGAYLLWLGVHALWRAARLEPAATVSIPAHLERWPAFRRGLVVNLLNPAILTFYVAAVPTFLPTGASVAHFLELSAIHVSIAFAFHSTWAMAFGHIGRVLESQTGRRLLSAATGVALVALAVRTVA